MTTSPPTASFMERMAKEAHLRRLRVVELRGKRLTFAEIGAILNITRAGAWRLWKEALERGEVEG